MNPLCRDEGIGLIPWTPLARGFLAGNRIREDRGETSRAKTDEFAHKLYYEESDFAVVDRVGEIAAKRGVSNVHVALAWLLHQPGLTAPSSAPAKGLAPADPVADTDLRKDIRSLIAHVRHQEAGREGGLHRARGPCIERAVPVSSGSELSIRRIRRSTGRHRRGPASADTLRRPGQRVPDRWN